MKKIYHIEPIYKSFIWAGQKLIKHFNIKTDLPSIGTIYHVIAIPGDLDNTVLETHQPLSEFYNMHRNLFQLKTNYFPIRMTTTANEGFQSYQLHPDDTYALEHENQKGKVSGAVALFDSPNVKSWLFGNKAKNKQEFKQLVLDKNWDQLFTTLDVQDGDFVHTPAGVIHGGYGSGQISATFGTNSDITYRFYDLDRNDPNRPLHLQQVFDCATVPEVHFEAKRVKPKEQQNLKIYDYYDHEKEYIAKRIKVNGSASYHYSRFMFIACVNGNGTINDEHINLGETIFVPADFGQLSLDGNMDLIIISYREN